MLTLTPDQTHARDSILSWFRRFKKVSPKLNSKQLAAQDSIQSLVLTLGGYAGTGKTTLISHIREDLGDEISVAFISFTGKAVSVMKKKLYESETALNNDYISTIHSFMYRPVVEKGKVVDWNFKPMIASDNEDMDFNPHISSKQFAPYVDLFIMDEASMTPESLMNDLKRYNKPILCIGDHGQLPPVKSNFSLMQSPDIRLETILRQAADSPIIRLATMAREGKPITYGEYSSTVRKISKRDFNNSSVEDKVALTNSSVMTIVATNAERVSFNKQLRKHSLNKTNEPPVAGDRIICLKNNHKEGLYNGMTGTIDKILLCTFFPDNNYCFTFTSDEGTTHTVNAFRSLFNNPKGFVSNNIPYYERGDSFDYGYVITCHKSQGSEAPIVVVFGNGFGDSSMRRRWLYTAITRAQKELYIVS